MARKTSDAAELLLRMWPRKPRRKLSLDEKTRLVLRVFDGEPLESIAFEADRSPETVKAWLSYYRCGLDVWRPDSVAKARAKERKAFEVLDGGAR